MTGEGSVSLDHILRRLGQWKLFNMYNFMLASLPVFFTGMYSTNYVFLAGDVPYRCKIPECESASNYTQPWLEHAIPPPESGKDYRCYRYQSRQPGAWVEGCSNHTFTDQLVPCGEWVYENQNTIVGEFGLACQEWKRTLVGTVHNFGMLVSLPIIGVVSDRFGRKTALTASAVIPSVFGLLKSFSSSYQMYAACEFLETVAGASVYPSAFVLVIELLGHERRVLVSFILGIALALGSSALSLLDLAAGYWRTWARVAYPPSILFLFYICLLPESIRWLLAKGRVDDAVKIIKKAARVNKVSIAEDSIQKLILSRENLNENKTDEPKKSLFMEVIHSPMILKRLLICATWWMTAVFVYYGLQAHSASMPGDLHLNYVLLSAMEIIAITINTATLNRLGRKPVLLSAFMVCGVACISLPFLPKSLPWSSTLFYLVGKVAISMALNGLYMYTSELFPTSARHSLLAFCSMTGRVGSLLAPQMPLLAIYMKSLPSILFGSLPILCAVFMSFMPETLHTRLPDSIAEAETLARAPPSRDHKF